MPRKHTKDPIAVELGARGGKASAKKRLSKLTKAQRSEKMRTLSEKRMDKLTPAQRSAIAKHAAKMREARKMTPKSTLEPVR